GVEERGREVETLAQLRGPTDLVVHGALGLEVRIRQRGTEACAEAFEDRGEARARGNEAVQRAAVGIAPIRGALDVVRVAAARRIVEQSLRSVELLGLLEIVCLVAYAGHEVELVRCGERVLERDRPRALERLLHGLDHAELRARGTVVVVL